MDLASRVDLHVRFKISSRTAFVIAKLAVMSFLLRMCEFMLTQNAIMTKAFKTLIAFVRLRPFRKQRRK